jgi:ABC-type amino acid transport system permease subunit
MFVTLLLFRVFTGLLEFPLGVYDIFSQYGEALTRGLCESIKLAMIVWITGLVLGGISGVLGAKFPKLFGYPLAGLAFILSGIPTLVFLFWLHYPVQAMFNVVIDPFITASVTLAIINTFAVSEIVRGALRDFPEHYLVAARVCGLGKWQTVRAIQLPLILRQILPALLTTQVTMLQATLFASLISVDEIFRTAQQINATIYKPVEIYTALGILFLAVCLPLNGLALWLRKHFTRNLSEN